MASDISKTFKLNIVGLRFLQFMDLGEPDMFLMKFLNSIYNKKFYLFNKGNHTRDFTYIDDAVEIMNALFKKIKGHHIFNIC